MASVDEDAVLLEDSQVQEAELAEDFAAQEVVSLQREIMAARLEKAKAEQRQREAAKQQAWDDWAVFEEMQSDRRPYPRARSFQVVDHVRDVATQTGEHEVASSSTDARRIVPMSVMEDDEKTEEWPPNKKSKAGKRASGSSAEVGPLEMVAVEPELSMENVNVLGQAAGGETVEHGADAGVQARGGHSAGPEQVGGSQPQGHDHLHFNHEGIAGVGYHIECSGPVQRDPVMDVEHGGELAQGESALCSTNMEGGAPHDTVVDPESAVAAPNCSAGRLSSEGCE